MFDYHDNINIIGNTINGSAYFGPHSGTASALGVRGYFNIGAKVRDVNISDNIINADNPGFFVTFPEHVLSTGTKTVTNNTINGLITDDELIGYSSQNTLTKTKPDLVSRASSDVTLNFAGNVVDGTVIDTPYIHNNEQSGSSSGSGLNFFTRLIQMIKQFFNMFKRLFGLA